MTENRLNSKGLNIVFAEDEEFNFIYAFELLREFNFNIIRAYNGQMALDLCQQHADIDLIFMDISMPIMDGFEATKLIKQLRPDIPVVIQTSYSHVTDKQIALEAGADEYLSKPYNQRELLRCIKRHVPEHEQILNLTL